MQVIKQNDYGRIFKHHKYLVIYTKATKLYYVKATKHNFASIYEAKKEIEEILENKKNKKNLTIKIDNV